LAEFVKLGVITKDEARAIALNKGKLEDPASKTTVVHLLVDASGSMESVRDATIQGYNEYINSLKEDGGKFKVSLNFFDSDYNGNLRLKQVLANEHIDDVPELNRETFVPDGGTPLYDAFCTTLKKIETRPTEKNLFVVLTDGGENSSKEYTDKDMKRLKKEYEDEGNWTFVYLGANQDSWETASKFGYSSSNVSNFNATQKGTGMAFVTLSAATRSYSAAPTMSTSAYFTEEQQKQNEETK
jgi:uncharacterized protein YegL